MRHFTFAFNLKQLNKIRWRSALLQLSLMVGAFCITQFNELSAQGCDPELTIVCPPDLVVECGDASPEITGYPTVSTAPCYTDGLDISFTDQLTTISDCELMITRTWMANADQDMEMCTQIITVEDTQAPELIMPDNLFYQLEWGVSDINVIDAFLAGEISAEEILALTPAYMNELEAQGFFWPSAEDFCVGEIEPTYLQTVYGSDELNCPVVAQVIWEFSATDACGNTSESVAITCDFYDTTAPEFLCTPEDMTVECLEDVPAPMTCEAIDSCDDEVSIEIFTSETGNPTDSCVATTAYGPGDDWAIWLPMLEVNGVTPTDDFVADGNLTFIQYDDGTAHLYGHVVNSSDASCGWDVDLWFNNKSDWAAWSAMGRSYKDDTGLGECCYEDWTYYELVNGFSTLTGTGCLDGAVLYLDHMPASYYFGFQCGQGANNRNGNFGMSGWFTYSGTIAGEAVEGHGDVNVDKECEPVNLQDCPNDDEFTYFWRAEDSCGNATVISQVITVDDQTPPTFTVVPEDITVECDELPVPLFEGVEAVDNCEGEVVIEYIGESDPEGDECYYTFTRTWAAFDLCGNRADWIQTITVEDTTPPVLDYAGGEMTLECDEEVVLPEVGATDNCQEPTVTMTMETEPGDCPQNWFEIYTWVANDGCGNESESASLVVEYVDTTAPEFDPYDVYIQVECNDIDSLEPLTATDNCGEVTITMEETLNSGGCLGVLYRVWTATDECGNSTETEQFITIIDTTPPVIENPEDMTVECDEVPETPGADGIEIYDNCGEDVTVEFTETITEGVCEDSYTITWTWTATDYCENVSTATTTITVVDTTDPIFTQVPDDMTYECDMEVPACDINNVVAEDNCDDDVTVTCEDEITPGDCPQEYTIMRIYRAFDNCGNQAIYVQNIYVVDTTAPMIEQPEPITLECTDTVELPEIVVTDNCGATTLDMTMETVPGDCAGNWVEYYTYTATDECGNVSEPVTLSVTYIDTTGPVFDPYDAEIDMPCDDISEGNLTATDACCGDDVTITYTDTPVSGGCAGRIIRDYVATDCCGNTSTAQQIITLIDEVPPVWTLFPADVTVECDDVPSNDEIEVDWTDNCTEVTLSYDGEVIIPGDCEDSYTIERTWTITDNCENTISATWTITVQDTTPPVFTAVADDVTVECDEELPAPFATAEDNCDPEVDITVTPEIIPGDCDAEYTMVRTYTATDDCGNSSTATQTITVVDTTAPVLDYNGGEMTLECDEELTLPEVGATDNCSTVEVNMTMATEPGDCPQNWFEIYTWTATDACGNMSDPAVLVVEYIDTTPPVFDPFEVMVQMPCDEVGELTLTATDNCSDIVDITITYVDMIQSGGCTGQIIRTYTATDECGNESTAMQIIDLVDDEAPMWTDFPSDITVECDDVPGIEGITLDYEDNCSEEIDLEYNGQEVIPGDCPQSYIVTHSWTITDHCDNANTAVWTITVQDTTAPMFTAVADDVTIECDEELPAPFATAEDNCDPEVDITVTPEIIPGDCDAEYTMVRTYTATDDCGNSSTATQTISVVDTTAPVLDYAGGQVSLECDEELNLPVVDATDNCSTVEVNMTMVTEPGDCPQNWYEIYTWVAVDACGNESVPVTLYVDYSDTTAPVFDPYDVEIEMPCDAITETTVTAMDDCGDVTITSSDEFVADTGCAGTIIRTFIATDDCGNSSTAEQIITLTDEVAPEFVEVPADMVYECDEEVPACSPEDVVVTDNCTEVTVTCSDEIEAGDCPQNYTILRTYVAIDNCDNMTSYTQTITVQDTTAPVFTAVAEDVTIECDEELPAPFATAEDNCDPEVDITVTPEIIPGDCDAEYTMIRTYTATDDCGNSSTATQTITVVDTTAPVLDYAGGQVSLECDEELILPEVGATDNCSTVEVTMTMVTEPGDCPQNWYEIYTWVAVDACGNESDPVSLYVDYSDNTAPVFNEIPEDISVECADDVPVMTAPAATDNCGVPIVVCETEVLEEDDCGNYYAIVTCTATDECGNSTIISYSISVYDETAPVFDQVLEANVVIDCLGEVPAAEECTATDNCDDDVSVTFTEELIGDLPVEGSIADCMLSTPAAVNEDGTTCDNNDPWSVRLFGFAGDEFYSNIEGQFVQFPDGTATLTATVVSTENPNAGWIVDVHFENGMDWDAWSTQGFPTSYKDDCGLGADDYQDWTYYIMSAGNATLTGWGDYAGSELMLAHAPSNLYYGYQVGNAANNVNDHYGNGGWFTYNGIFNQQTVTGSGDFAFDMDCCPQYSIERTWCAEDCTGNMTCFTQIITFEDLSTESGIVTPEASLTPTDKDGELIITRLNPNPAVENVHVEFMSKFNANVRLEVYDISGRNVMTLYNGWIEANEFNSTDFDASELQDGIYTIRLFSALGSDQMKLVVAR